MVKIATKGREHCKGSHAVCAPVRSPTCASCRQLMRPQVYEWVWWTRLSFAARTCRMWSNHRRRVAFSSTSLKTMNGPVQTMPPQSNVLRHNLRGQMLLWREQQLQNMDADRCFHVACVSVSPS